MEAARRAPDAGTPTFDFDAVDFVTADHHFGHARIIEHARRPFGNVEEMDSYLVERWNSIVPPDAVVLHLGDLLMASMNDVADALALTRQLHGRRLLVPGNHDWISRATQTRTRIESMKPLYESAGWTVLPEVLSGSRNGHPLRASHYPYDTAADDRFSKYRPTQDGIPLIHGHTRSPAVAAIPFCFHVGVDAWEYSPAPMTDIDDWLDSFASI
ncbi:metallophosphoesterase [Curtobacterium sp. MCSS17_015]|uniref:metallophosphoesterase n=1 Tax=Curtobacterium sp. MCSS17_015 TaxID=2175666 RepID=UPI000DA8B975|nr:metallophosphoesterase [Curtobacterium sp. MCSS17_015]WIB26626.1 metallophosphoesterase [Curtobacterium sp. MCSS17_015]